MLILRCILMVRRTRLFFGEFASGRASGRVRYDSSSDLGAARPGMVEARGILRQLLKFCGKVS